MDGETGVHGDIAGGDTHIPMKWNGQFYWL